MCSITLMQNESMTVERLEQATDGAGRINRAARRGELSLSDLIAMRSAIYKRKADDKNPGRWTWEGWPQGWMKYKAWSRRSHARTRALRAVQNLIKQQEAQ